MELERENAAKPRARYLALVASLTLISACADDAGIGGTQIKDTPPPSNQPPQPSEPLTRITEDFANRQLVERTSGVDVDVNTGVLKLPTRPFPQIEGARLLSYSTETNENGVIAAEQILVEEQGIVHASDSIELTAKDVLRVTGQIRAGRGGVTLAAGNKIIVDGRVESEGPVRLLLAGEEGAIEIGGTILAISAPDGLAPSVELVARGRVIITGTIVTDAARGPVSGDILVHTYGSITLDDYGLITTIAPGAVGGAIRLKSETEVHVLGGARIGGEMQSVARSALGLAAAGEIQIEGNRVHLGSNTTIQGMSTDLANGGTIGIAAGSLLTIDTAAVVLGGEGVAGGTVSIQAASADLREGSLIMGGLGRMEAGVVSFASSGPVRLAPSATIVGGAGGCTAGGPVIVHVAGVLTLDNDSKIKGGNGGTLAGSSAECREQLHKGGDVEVLARAIDGVTEAAISGGEGSTPGMVALAIDPSYEVAPPNLTVATHGFVISKLIDRGEDARGQVPVLIDIQLTAPTRTGVQLELGGTDDPAAGDELWIDLMTANKDSMELLRGLRYFRYRVTLSGRAFDSPELDFFDIDLAPRFNTSR